MEYAGRNRINWILIRARGATTSERTSTRLNGQPAGETGIGLEIGIGIGIGPFVSLPPVSVGERERERERERDCLSGGDEDEEEEEEDEQAPEAGPETRVDELDYR